MKWRGRGSGGRIEDRRGRGGGGLGGGFGGGGGMPFPMPMGRAGGGGLGMIVLIVLFLVLSRGCGGASGFQVDPGTGAFPQAPSATPSTDLEATPSDDAGAFVDFVAGDIEATWQKIFANGGKMYEPTTIVLYDDAVQTSCGNAPAQVGPFYCPRDRKVYLDLTFMEELQRRVGATGDFAQAYIVAHEIAHHVQNLLGVMDDVNLAQQENPDDANELSVRLELQADCLAGIWGHSAYQQQDLLEQGDVEEGLNAAAAVGDDRIQKGAGQQVNPESFTHGSAEQRVTWFKKGFETGDPTACDTFKGEI